MGGARASLDGTYFFGGAGMNGGYIGDMVTALSGAGISDVFAVDAGKWSGGTALDAGVGVFALRDEMVNFPIVLRSQGDGNGQLNLVGYSFGSLVAAQVAGQACQRRWCCRSSRPDRSAD